MSRRSTARRRAARGPVAGDDRRADRLGRCGAAAARGEGREVRALRGKFVMPGIIDSHVHLGLVDGVDQNFTKYYDRANIEAQLRLYAAYGVTSVYTLGTDGDEIHRVISDQRRAGRIDMARAFTAGRGVVYKRSYGGVPGLEQSVATPAEATAMVVRETARGDDFVKLWMDDEFGTVAKRMPYTISTAVIDAAHKAGKQAAAHIFYYDNAAELTREDVDVFMHQVRDPPADSALARAMKAKGTWQLASTLSREASFTYTLLPFVDEPFFARGVAPATIATLKSAERQQRLAASPLFAEYPPVLTNAMGSLAAEAKAGVRYGMGTDSGPTARFPGYFAHWKLELMVKAGLTPLQALTAATGTNAGFLRDGGVDDGVPFPVRHGRGGRVPHRHALAVALDAAIGARLGAGADPRRRAAGRAVTPVFVVLLILDFGWRAPFLLFAGVGIAWALLWFWFIATPRANMRGWFPAFMVLAVLCLIAAILFLWIDASRRLDAGVVVVPA